MSSVGLVCVILIILSMLLVNAAGEPMPPPPPHRLNATARPSRVAPGRTIPPHRNLTGTEHGDGHQGGSGETGLWDCLRAFESTRQHRLHPLADRTAGCSLTSVGMRANLSKRLPLRMYEALEPALYPLVLFLGYFSPLAILIGLAGMLWPHEPLGCWVYGSGILLGGMSMLLFLLGLGMWRARQWAVSGSVAAALALSALLPLIQQLLLVMQLPSCAVECDDDDETNRCTLTEFPYTAVTAISMALNSLPVIAIVFLQLGARPLARAVSPSLLSGALASGASQHPAAFTAWQATDRASRCSNTCQTSPTPSLWSWDIAALGATWCNSSASTASRS